MRALYVITALCAASRLVSAQDPFTNAKKAAQNAANAASAHVRAEQRPDGPQTGAPAAAPAARTPAKAGLPAAALPGTQLTIAKRDTLAVPPTIMREEYDYGREGRRDPFVSLLTTNELRPTISDLRLTGVLYDHAGTNSVATLRDLTDNKQYRVKTGTTLGRMRVTAIKTTTVIFTIDEFGTTRQDSLILHDPTKARAR
jgi:hypothetical protein